MSSVDVELLVTSALQQTFTAGSPGEVFVRVDIPEAPLAEVMVGSLCNGNGEDISYHLKVRVEGCAHPGVVEAWIAPSTSQNTSSYDCEVENIMVSNLLPPKENAPYVSVDIFTQGDALCNGEQETVALTLE